MSRPLGRSTAPKPAGGGRGGPQAPRIVWVPVIRVTSWDLRVLMDQPTEPISSHDPPRRRQANWLAGLRRRLPQGAVRAAAVVMVNVLGQYRLQLPASQDQQPVEHLPPDGAHPAMGVGICRAAAPAPGCAAPRSPRQQRPRRGGELGVPIADQEPEPPVRSSRAMNGAVALVLKESGGETLAMTTAQAERGINSTSHPAAGRRSDRAVETPSTDHLRRRLPRRSHSSEPTTDLLAPTGTARGTRVWQHRRTSAVGGGSTTLSSRERRELAAHRPCPTLRTPQAPAKRFITQRRLGISGA
jgi:hypothetical protein